MHLVVNAGSSSLKWAVYPALEARVPSLAGQFEGFGEQCRLIMGDQVTPLPIQNHGHAVQYMLRLLEYNNIATAQYIKSVTHRVVHGGEKYRTAVVISPEVINEIEKNALLAPLHNPANLQGIRACEEAIPQAVQIAVFDTAFHQTISKEVFLYAIPQQLYEHFGIRKYGFHGTSHAYMARLLKQRYGEPVDAISCHLGSGSSITALKQGRSVDTTMGFTPLDGLMMATRSGEIDPDIPLFLIREHNMSVEQVEEILYKHSGLRAIAGDSDLRHIHVRAERGEERARLAIKMLSYRVAYYINAMRTLCPLPKAIVFTGGIGEKAWYVRKQACDFLGIKLNEQANQENMTLISSPSSPIEILVFPTDEQLEMHLQSRAVLQT